MMRVWFGVLMLTAWAAAASGTVVIELGDEPRVEALRDAREPAGPAGGLFDVPTKANAPANGQWFVPYYRADKLNDGDSTYFSVRNESSVSSQVTVEFFDVGFDLETSQVYDVEPREVAPVAVRYVPNLTIGGDGYARGFLRITSAVPVTVDSFQLETRNSFAVGGVGFVIDDFCTRWNARFLRFDAAGGTVLDIMVNGPQGSRPSDLVTIAGDVYSEAGEYVSSFEIRTDDWALEVPISDLVPPDLDFGVVELVVNAMFLPAGIVEVRHRALGQYSVGHRAICRD